jgi:hypothetical protein
VSRRRVLPAVAVAAVATLAWPAAAMAHGLTARADLPLPRWLFGWGAAVVLVISFLALAVLWPKPKLEEARSRPIPGSRLLTSRVVEILCGAIGVAVLALVIYVGFAGEQTPSSNIAPVIVFITFWVGFVPLSVVFGNVFAAFNPWRAIGRVVFRSARRPYPARLGRWPAALVLIAFSTFELAVRQSSAPEKVAVVAVAYSVVTLVCMAVYGVEAWIERGEGFSVYFDLFSRMAPFGREGDVIVLRPPLAGLPKLVPMPGTTMVVAVMIGSLTYDGMAEASFYQDVAQALRDVAGALGAGDVWQAQIAAFLGLMGSIVLVLLLYWVGCVGASLVDRTTTPTSVANAFAHSLVPIAFAYVSAHYFTLLLFQGQTIVPLASDPLGHGSDLFGTADWRIDYGLIGAESVWYIQVILVVVGHALALALAHDRALVLYRLQRDAVRSQFWMLGVMVVFTSLALFLLSQANA